MRTAAVILALIAACCAVEHFYVVDPTTKNACLIIDADVTFTLNFVELDSNNTKTFTTSLNETMNTSGDCHLVKEQKTWQTITIEFLPTHVSPLTAKPWVLSLWFTSSDTKAFVLTDYTLETQMTSDVPYFGSFRKATDSDEDVSATGKNGYQCSTSKLALQSDDAPEGSYISLKNVRAISNAIGNGTDFQKDTQFEVCYLDSRTSNIVPMVVGGCLAALVLIVLVAYLIGRARAKRQGYASV